MKIFSYILLVISIICNEGIKAQLASYNWSEVSAKDDKKIDKIISFEESSIVVFKPFNSIVRLDVFFDKGQKTSQDVAFEGTFLSTLRVNNSVVIFSTVFNSRSKKNELLAKLITPNSTKELKIIEQALQGTLHNSFKVSVSPNFKHVFVLTEKPHKKGKKEAVVFTVLNEEFETERTTPYLMNALYSQKRRINVPVINNNGEAYVLKRYRQSNKSNYYILGYNQAKNVAFKEFKLNYKPIKDAQYELDSEGFLIVGGTYTSPNSSKAEGVYIAKFDVSGNKIFRKEYGFRQETMLSFTSERALRKEGLGLNSFRTNRIIEQKENLSLIIEHRVSLPNSKTGVNTEQRDGLIIYSFDKEGNFIWDNSVRMNQKDVSEKGYWNSFICFNDTAKNNLSIIYNEVGYYDKNADNDFGENVAVGARNIVLNNQGETEKVTVKNCFKGALIDLVISPKTYLQKGSSMLILAEPLDKSVYVLGVIE